MKHEWIGDDGWLYCKKCLEEWTLANADQDCSQENQGYTEYDEWEIPEATQKATYGIVLWFFIVVMSGLTVIHAVLRVLAKL